MGEFVLDQQRGGQEDHQEEQYQIKSPLDCTYAITKKNRKVERKRKQ